MPADTNRLLTAKLVDQYQQALSLDPGNFAAWNDLGNIFASFKDWPTARIFLEEAERLNPQNAAVQNNLANILEKSGEPERSVAAYRAAIALEPNNAQFRNNLGNTLRTLRHWSAAEDMLTSAIALRPNYPAAYANLAYLCYEQGRLDEAEKLYRTTLELDPNHALAHTCLGQLLLYRGCFREGWKEQEWRWQWDDFPSPPRHFQQPQWYGEDLAGKRILLHAEQGFGDTIQFARYAEMVAALGAHVILEVHPELLNLMRSVSGVSEILARGDPVPPFDLHCPLMSLPLAFDTTVATIPTTIPYLDTNGPTPAWVDRTNASSRRVGLAWAGNPGNRVDHRRSVPIAALIPFSSVPGVEFYSFQRSGTLDIPDGLHFQGILPASGDFAATASALQAMDLLISVDTAVAHLAGALGVPVWIMLPYVSDWRWLKGEPLSPWYPTATLFRQSEDQRWESVIAAVRDTLLTWSSPLQVLLKEQKG
jgi:Flp pilus assembly protein TadD